MTTPQPRSWFLALALAAASPVVSHAEIYNPSETPDIPGSEQNAHYPLGEAVSIDLQTSGGAPAMDYDEEQDADPGGIAKDAAASKRKNPKVKIDDKDPYTGQRPPKTDPSGKPDFDQNDPYEESDEAKKIREAMEGAVGPAEPDSGIDARKGGKTGKAATVTDKELKKVLYGKTKSRR